MLKTKKEIIQSQYEVCDSCEIRMKVSTYGTPSYGGQFANGNTYGKKVVCNDCVYKLIQKYVK